MEGLGERDAGNKGHEGGIWDKGTKRTNETKGTKETKGMGDD